jgi:hypothetical protein
MSELLPERNKVLERNQVSKPSKKQNSQNSSAQVAAVDD